MPVPPAIETLSKGLLRRSSTPFTFLQTDKRADRQQREARRDADDAPVRLALGPRELDRVVSATDKPCEVLPDLHERRAKERGELTTKGIDRLCRKYSAVCGFDFHLVKPVEIDAVMKLLAGLKPATAERGRPDHA